MAIAGLQLDVLHKVIGFLAVTGWSDLLRTIAGQGRWLADCVHRCHFNPARFTATRQRGLQ